mmetsp:Transcript_36690/g.88429  ORF Transcript_36690/g.88429 Transcript_36690/m.88429 type:complete len:107 (-) Transcript_36690:206-526(-)
MVKKSLLKIKTTTTAGDNYNHYGVSAGDGEAEAGEEGAYGNARGRSQQQAMTVAAAKVWIKGWERAKGLRHESRSRLVNRKLSMVVHHGCGSKGIGGIHEQQPHGR